MGSQRVLVAIEVVVAPRHCRLRTELTAGEETPEGLPELVRHRVVQDGVDGAETEGREERVQRKKVHSKIQQTNSIPKIQSCNMY